jgi:hypothetical protein
MKVSIELGDFLTEERNQAARLLEEEQNNQIVPEVDMNGH